MIQQTYMSKRCTLVLYIVAYNVPVNNFDHIRTEDLWQVLDLKDNFLTKDFFRSTCKSCIRLSLWLKVCSRTRVEIGMVL